MKSFVTLVLIGIGASRCVAYHSCKDLKTSNPSAENGEYDMYNGQGKTYKAYCEFHGKHGYQFLSKESSSFVHSALNLIKPSTKEVLVRHVRSNGKQYDTILEELSEYASQQPLSIQYNQNVGYATPLNHNTWAPYLYLGFLPRNVANGRTTQGYRANGRDYTFRNCDSNPNSYLAFFSNANHGDPTDYHNRCCYTPLMRNWIDAATPATNNLPCEYFFQFEMHMGGCGGYAINGYHTLQDIVGAALGLRFELDCTPEPSLEL